VHHDAQFIEKNLSLQLHFNQLEQSKHLYMGRLLGFDNLTALHKAKISPDLQCQFNSLFLSSVFDQHKLLNVLIIHVLNFYVYAQFSICVAKIWLILTNFITFEFSTRRNFSIPN
jgi:hypothetical protein